MYICQKKFFSLGNISIFICTCLEHKDSVNVTNKNTVSYRIPQKNEGDSKISETSFIIFIL